MHIVVNSAVFTLIFGSGDPARAKLSPQRMHKATNKIVRLRDAVDMETLAADCCFQLVWSQSNVTCVHLTPLLAKKEMRS